MELEFAMPMKFKDELKNSDDFWEVNTWRSWKNRLQNKTWYLIGWSDSSYTITDKIGSNHFEYISGKPQKMFARVNE